MEYGNYSILSSLNERTIYLKITDNIGFLQYESNIDVKELRLSIDLSDAFTVIKNCFQKKEGYNVIISHITGNLKLQFSALVGGFLKMNFELLLKERVMSNDAQLTTTINKLEQKVTGLEKQLVKKNEELQDMTDKLSYSMICLWNGNHINSANLADGTLKPYMFPSLNIVSLNIEDSRVIRYDLIRLLYKLEKFQINIGGQGAYQHTNINISGLSSNSLSVFELSYSTQLTSLLGLHKLPNLTTIMITGCNYLKDIPTILNSYQHKIKKIVIKSCTAVNVVEIQTYCQKNNIELDIS
jgi:hypothetical protein